MNLSRILKQTTREYSNYLNNIKRYNSCDFLQLSIPKTFLEFVKTNHIKNYYYLL